GSTYLHVKPYMSLARSALRVFDRLAPTGVRIHGLAPDSAHYLLYSFDTHQLVLNAFAQTLNGLYDFYLLAGHDEHALRLFQAGVGKPSVTAASARRCAASGLRTVVLSTDPAHSLSDSFDAELGSSPTPCGDNLWGQEVQAQEEMERHWEAVQDWMGEMLAERGVDRITADELTVPPGMDELFSLLQIKRHHETGDYDTIVVDCAPTGETLRLLSFPDVASWWLEKVFPIERRLM